MKKFTTHEIKNLFNRVMTGEISFFEMVEMINERVSKINESQFNDGDFVVNKAGSILIFKKKVEDFIYDHAYFSELFEVITVSNSPTKTPIERYATEEEKQKMLDVLTKKGKRWNEEKKCIEDIPTELKEGDFVAGLGCIFILHKRIDGNSAQFYVLYAKTNGRLLYHKTYFNLGGIDKLGLATESEKQELIDVLAKEGKMWNAEKRCVENIPKRKFKKGDKVRIKDGVSSETHYGVRPGFARKMDDLIGKTMTIAKYADLNNYVNCEETEYYFLEEWLEPYEGLKKGDLAIFWDDSKEFAFIGKYNGLLVNRLSFPHKDHSENIWQNAIKFESKEQYERLINGED